MGDLLAVTAQAARVIEESANDEIWRKAALAARAPGAAPSA